MRGLSLEDGAATITEFTGKLLADATLNYISKFVFNMFNAKILLDINS